MAQAHGKAGKGGGGDKGKRKLVGESTAANPVDVSDDDDLENPGFRPRFVGSNQRTDDGNAFFADPADGPARVNDDLAEFLAEDFIKSATSGEDAEDETVDEVVDEEFGGPFVETSAREEFANDTDESNPEDAVPEPLPRAIHGIIDPPPRPR
jgi:hypothetical protein